MSRRFAPRRHGISNEGRQGDESGGFSTQGVVDQALISSAEVTSRANTLTVSDDVRRKAPSFQVVQRPPKNYINQIAWTQVKLLQSATSIVIPGTNVENNLLFTLNQFPAAGAITSLFDQYCLYEVAVTFYLQGSVNQTVAITTAIDYDNITNIGISGISGFPSCNHAVLNSSNSVVRVVRPCVSPVISGTTGAGVVGSGIVRSWIDSGNTNIPHYGVRFIAEVSQLSSGTNVFYDIAAIIGMRNKI